MSQWKVGSITLGLILIASGILVLISNILGVSFFEQIIIWWPAVLIVLGIEVLISFFLSQEQPSTVHYNGVSIFLIIILIFGMLGMGGLCKLINRYPNSFGFLRDAVKSEQRVPISDHKIDSSGSAITADQ